MAEHELRSWPVFSNSSTLTTSNLIYTDNFTGTWGSNSVIPYVLPRFETEIMPAKPKRSKPKKRVVDDPLEWLHGRVGEYVALGTMA